MANTYSQIYLQFVFVVQGRHDLISFAWEERLYQYIAGIIRADGHKLYAINGMEDHIHVLISMNPKTSISALAQLIKCNSSKFINEEKLVKGKFYWQKGYGVFSYSHSAISNVCKYIMNQKVHHRRESAKKEYVSMLETYEVSYDERYLFDFE